MSSAATFTAEDGTSYRDHKRYSWFVSLLVPSLTMLGPILFILTGDALLLWVPVAFNYLGMPLLDVIMGEDRSNPPEQVVPLLEKDNYYRYVTYALVPLLWIFFIACAWFVGTYELPWHGLLAVAITAGGTCGYGLNLGHEIGHKPSKLEKNLAKLVLSLGGYGHFTLEHNMGHHRDVATPEDSASSRMGESIWKFALRELPGGWTRAWSLESARLAKRGLPIWSHHNEILQPLAITLVLYTTLIILFGWIMIPFLALTAFWGAFQLTSANYIEHYGLLRQKLENGRYERCQPHHSWNSNHLVSNWALFHLQRHSDHHAYPNRRYQSLRHFANLPELPNGYFGMYALAYFPPIWFRVMNPRLIRWAEGKASRINFDPSKKDALIARYGLAP
ncbi:alkane 1-monooxygenase [Aestuariirhabdus sp. Z084]|uniref:alkane 1-monooxygenase n=1 Tax=Aestuariirhabdus haliotis TaxID=2918751 RepID=UPI00201B460B|nr:alkane 1-monooxygenase [Aestuariirhabdus haliotis]MCL6414915.1 alkane 1-monooxygenase [Aestuariirhabdus haliotis]MCL6418847.1 alkane 1-monooxygenase [Aestuariirhabdus haliotis]